MIKIKRVYEEAQAADGQRFLVDRLWPRGVKKDSLDIKAWIKDVAPSNELRKWYSHDPQRWDEFRERYFEELDSQPQSWQPLLEAARHGDVTLLYASRETQINNAAALREYLEQKLEQPLNPSPKAQAPS